MLRSAENGSPVKERILSAAIPVFGRFGFRKTSVDELARAAEISKQGLYLHFSSKEEVFIAAMRKYVEDGLKLVQQALSRPDASLYERLLDAMDVWFGRHLATFSPDSFDVIEAGKHLSGEWIEECKAAFQAKLAKAIADSSEFKASQNVCSPKEVSQVLFLCGLTWKEGQPSRAEFLKQMGQCIRACCQIKAHSAERSGQ